MGVSPGPTINWESPTSFCSHATSGSYEDAILVRYDINDETYRQRFRAASCKDGETYQELAVRTLDLLNKYYKDDPQKILEQIATEQLLGKMTREIQIYVRERKPESAMQAGGLADDYVQPLRDGTKVQEKTESSTRCQYCEKRGHTAKECRKAAAERSPSSSSRTETAKWKDKRVCYSCREVGHIAPNCPLKKPSDAAYVDQNMVLDSPNKPVVTKTGVTRCGEVEGVPVQDITLDTGSARTIINSKLVADSTEITGTVPIRCAHGDVQIYPLAQVEIRVGEKCFMVEAAVSKTLPLSVLLGRDVPELFDLLNPTEDAMVVATRAQTKRQTEENARLEEADCQSGAEPHILLDESAVPEDSQAPLGTELDGDHGIAEEFDFDPELFITKEPRIRKTKRVKREERHEYLSRHTQSLSREELKELQQNDESLSVLRRDLSEGRFLRER